MYLFACVKDIKKLDETVAQIKEVEGVVNSGKLFSEDETNKLIWILVRKDQEIVMKNITENVTNIISLHEQGDRYTTEETNNKLEQ